MAVITEATRAPGADLSDARKRTRELAFGQIIGAVFPIRVGPEKNQKAWYRVDGLRPLTIEWLPYTEYRVDPDALVDLSKASIYRLIETDI